MASLKQTASGQYKTIKQLVFNYVHRHSGIVDYEDLSREVLSYFPSSRWNPAHWTWYRSLMRTGGFPGEFTEEELKNLGAAGPALPKATIKELGDEILNLAREMIERLQAGTRTLDSS